MGQLPENTLESFHKAIELDADGIELDVQLSRDGRLVVIHDETLNRVCGKTYLPPLYVKDFSLCELKKMDVSASCPGALFVSHIPALEEVLELVKPTSLLINIELKTDIISYNGIEEKLIQTVRDFGLNQRIIYSSFNHLTVARIKRLASESNTAFILSQKLLNVAEYAAKYGINAIHPDFHTFAGSPDMTEQCRKHSVDVRVWNIRDKDVDFCREQHVDAIITNYPERFTNNPQKENYEE